jgi:uncharacterized protein (DUF58 family)
MDGRPAIWDVYFTARGIAVLAAVPVLYLVGELFGFAFARALAGVALAAIVVAVPLVMRRPRVDVRREVYPDRVERDEPAMAGLQVRNPSGRRHSAFIAKDVVDDVHRDVQVRALAPYATATYRYQLQTTRRGRFQVGPLVLERSDPLGLLRSVLITGSVAHLWVHPRRHPVRTAGLGWPRYHHDGLRSAHPPAGSADLRRIREYVPGDETRHVHWKAVARTGTLMVREYSDPSEPRLTVVLDNRVSVLSAAAFEEAVEVAASFACAALDARYRTTVVTTCGDLQIENNAGLAGIREVLDRLAELAQGRGGGAAVPDEPGALIFVGGALDGAGLGGAGLGGAGLSGDRAAMTAFDLRGAGSSPQGRPPGVAVIAADSASEAVRRWNVTARW